MAFCSNCGGELNDSQDICLNCGVYVNRVESTKEGKSRIAAGVLGILLGGLGIHKFYMGRAGMGILYIIFCWTFIPSIVGFVEGIIYLCENDASFQARL
jgi:TM2 domain-containing membrane protein YozV